MGNGAAKKILIVDDDVALMRVMREALTSMLRCEVDTSPKPEYGFELALKKTYDLMLFDFSMPMIDGAMLSHWEGLQPLCPTQNCAATPPRHRQGR